MHFLLFCLPICSWCDVFFTFLSREGRIPALIPPTVTTGAAVGFGVIVRSAGLAILAKVARASSNDAAADLGQGVSLGLFFWDLGCTCWTRIQSAASTSEYPFALIAAGIESLVSGFASQARKKRAAFFARSSTLYPFQGHIEVLASENTENGLRQQ